jgi:DNA-binding HxlR family transcriptional regulator
MDTQQRPLAARQPSPYWQEPDRRTDRCTDQGCRGLRRTQPRAGRGISDSMPSARLTGPIECSLVERIVVDSPPVGVRYRPTTTGRPLIPALQELGLWAQTCFLGEPPSAPAGTAA